MQARVVLRTVGRALEQLFLRDVLLILPSRKGPCPCDRAFLSDKHEALIQFILLGRKPPKLCCCGKGVRQNVKKRARKKTVRYVLISRGINSSCMTIATQETSWDWHRHTVDHRRMTSTQPSGAKVRNAVHGKRSVTLCLETAFILMLYHTFP